MITILKALYGPTDVTEQLKQLILDNTPNTIVANNKNFGDPAVGSKKRMSIDYIDNDIIKHIDVDEDRIISFSRPIFEFIIPTFDRVEPLYSMLASLIAQTKNNWKATIIIDGNNNDIVKNIVNKFDSPNIHYTTLDKRYNDWGHTPRNVGKNLSTSDYIILTGDDNYYVPTFIDELNEIIINGHVGMIYWDMIHNGYEYNFFKTTINDGRIDMGSFVTRRDLAQQIDLTKDYNADSQYVLQFQKQFPNEEIIKINKILFVHN
jgi:hypothetical protein